MWLVLGSLSPSPKAYRSVSLCFMLWLLGSAVPSGSVCAKLPLCSWTPNRAQTKPCLRLVCSLHTRSDSSAQHPTPLLHVVPTHGASWGQPFACLGGAIFKLTWVWALCAVEYKRMRKLNTVHGASSGQGRNQRVKSKYDFWDSLAGSTNSLEGDVGTPRPVHLLLQ